MYRGLKESPLVFDQNPNYILNKDLISKSQTTFVFLLGKVRLHIANTAMEAPHRVAEAFQELLTAIERLNALQAHLSLKMNIKRTPEVSEQVKKMLTARSQFDAFMYTDKSLYNSLSLLLTEIEKSKTGDLEELYIVAKRFIAQMERSGILLGTEEKEKLKDLNDQLVQQRHLYNENIQQDRDSLFITITGAGLRGLASEVQSEITAMDNSATGYQVPFSSGFFPFIAKYSEDYESRKKAILAMRSIGKSNYAVAQKIVDLSHEKAILLGFANAAELLMTDNMVKDSAEVVSFASEMFEYAQPLANDELEELKTFGLSLLGRAMDEFDELYVKEKHIQSLFSLDPQEISNFLPEEVVLKGMLSVMQESFGLVLEPTASQSLPHPSCLLYTASDASGNPLGYLMLDLFQRSGKRGGGFCGAIGGRSKDSQGNITALPYVYVIANNPLASSGANLFTFEALETLFHEMGHAMHHFFSDNALMVLNGTRQVELDAVEFPSRLVEFFCTRPEFLTRHTRHIDSGEPMSRGLAEKIAAAAKYQMGVRLAWRSIQELLDISIYAEPGVQVKEKELSLIERMPSLSTPEAKAVIPSLHHIFTARYAAGLYSYRWAEIMAFDAYAAISGSCPSIPPRTEKARAEKAMITHFKETIYKSGGRSSLQELFTLFRGREVDSSYYLKSITQG